MVTHTHVHVVYVQIFGSGSPCGLCDPHSYIRIEMCWRGMREGGFDKGAPEFAQREAQLAWPWNPYANAETLGAFEECGKERPHTCLIWGGGAVLGGVREGVRGQKPRRNWMGKMRAQHPSMTQYLFALTRENMANTARDMYIHTYVCMNLSMWVALSACPKYHPLQRFLLTTCCDCTGGSSSPAGSGWDWWAWAWAWSWALLGLACSCSCCCSACCSSSRRWSAVAPSSAAPCGHCCVLLLLLAFRGCELPIKSSTRSKSIPVVSSSSRCCLHTHTAHHHTRSTGIAQSPCACVCVGAAAKIIAVKSAHFAAGKWNSNINIGWLWFCFAVFFLCYALLLLLRGGSSVPRWRMELKHECFRTSKRSHWSRAGLVCWPLLISITYLLRYLSISFSIQHWHKVITQSTASPQTQRQQRQSTFLALY